MPAASKPGNEEERLQKLYSYEILDSLPESRFDDLAALAAKTLGRPIALISFVDKDRQWLKARFGLEVTETPREHAFCAYTILDHKPFVVENAVEHPRVSDNPLVTGEPHIRFYAGAPIITSDDYALGSLCVIDQEAGKISEEELEILEGFARQVAVQLEYTFALKRLAEANGKLVYEQKQAQVAKVAKSKFLANLSHELRTPMNAIMGFTDRLKKRLSDTIPERDMDSLETVSRNANTLLEMINNLIDISRLEAGAVTAAKENLPITALLKKLERRIVDSSEQLSPEFLFDADTLTEEILADDELLLRALLQLAANVVHTTEGNTLYCDLESIGSETAAKDIVVSLRSCRASLSSDFAISSIDYESMLDEVNQALATMIAHEHIELHKGQLEIRYAEGVGIEFRVQLPVHGKESQVPHVAVEKCSEENAPTVLCIDDDEDTLKYLGLTLEDGGYRVLLARDHDHALALFQKAIPDLICLDLCMPGKSGLDVIESLKKLYGELEVPVVVVTSLGQDEPLEFRGLHSDIQKPVTAERLLVEVQDALANGKDRAAIS